MIDPAPSVQSLRTPPRRSMLKGAALLALGIAAVLTQQDAAELAEPLMPIPVPTQVPVKEGVAELSGTRLYYWDTGGSGPALVLLHPATGSALMWVHQQPAFAQAGYRVIGYSRRGYFGSRRRARTIPASAPTICTSSSRISASKNFMPSVRPPAAASRPITRCRIPNGC